MKTAATRRPSVICLYGQWKIGRKIGINFEMEYEKGKVRVIEFSGRLDVLRRDRLEFCLLNKRKEDMGMRLICTHRFMKNLDAEFFVRLERSAGEKVVAAGITIPF